MISPLELARQCGALDEVDGDTGQACVSMTPDQLAAFTARVRADALEEAANAAPSEADSIIRELVEAQEAMEEVMWSPVRIPEPDAQRRLERREAAWSRAREYVEGRKG